MRYCRNVRGKILKRATETSARNIYNRGFSNPLPPSTSTEMSTNCIQARLVSIVCHGNVWCVNAPVYVPGFLLSKIVEQISSFYPAEQLACVRHVELWNFITCVAIVSEAASARPSFDLSYTRLITLGCHLDA